MTIKNLDLGDISIPMRTYATEGNAMLGIRGSGKSYGATMVAEQMLEQGIPIIVFDPIGLWRNLKVPGKGRGYPVVVAHPENGDLPLTVESAPEIVRAAMHHNISLVMDLYSVKLSKADWRKIVEVSVRILLHENKDYGIRHIFLEEASEFVPQRIQPDQSRVYSELEKLARMGGNAYLGYTLINQRSQEVNKAVLELCECLFLFRQRGARSLESVEKWMEYLDKAMSRELVQTTSNLKAGECWVWPPGKDMPVRLQLPEKHSFHPDREHPEPPKSKMATNVSAFVDTLKGSLAVHIEKAKANDPELLKQQIRALEKQLHNPSIKSKPDTSALQALQKDNANLVRQFNNLKSYFSGSVKRVQSSLEKVSLEISKIVLPELPSGIALQVTSVVNGAVTGVSVVSAGRGYIEPDKGAAKSHGYTTGDARTVVVGDPPSLHKGELKILSRVVQAAPLIRTKTQVATLSEMTASGGTFLQYFRNLKRLGLVEEMADGVHATEAGTSTVIDSLGGLPAKPQTPEELHSLWRARLHLGEAKLLDALIAAHPEWMSREDLANAVDMTADGGTFLQYTRTLVRNNLAERSGATYRATNILFEI